MINVVKKESIIISDQEIISLLSKNNLESIGNLNDNYSPIIFGVVFNLLAKKLNISVGEARKNLRFEFLDLRIIRTIRDYSIAALNLYVYQTI